MTAVSNVTQLPSFDQVTEDAHSENEGHDFWWSAVGQSFAILLKTNQYSEDDQRFYVRWFQQWITASLGPRPINGKPHYGATFVYDGSPVEFSVNWKEKKPEQTVRFTIEPCSSKAGTAADPLNQLAAKDLLQSMARVVPGIDLTRFNLFLSETHVPDEEADEVLAKLPAGIPRARVLVAFDLERGGIVAKVYFNPVLKAIASGKSIPTVVFDAIRKCNGPAGSYNASIGLLDEFLESCGPSEVPHIFTVSNDCVSDTPNSRAKVYTVAPITTLKSAKNVFSLGGRLSGVAIEGGLKAVGDFWGYIFGFDSPHTDFEEKEVLPAGTRCVFVFEMRPGKESGKVPNIEVKMHMPALWLGETDTQVCDKLSSWFKSHGHDQLSGRYQQDMNLIL
jgi:DMATS type aromatic prenyltransferase